MEEEELACGASFWSSTRGDAAVGAPFWCSDEEEHPSAEHTAHAIARVAEAPHVAHALHGHAPPDPSVVTSPASSSEIDEIMAAVADERIAERVAPPPAGTVEMGSLGTPFDPTYRPPAGEAPNYPPRWGAAGEVTDVALEPGFDLSRINSEYGDFFAYGDPTRPERAVAPTYVDGVETPFIGEVRDYTVARELIGEESVIAPAFGHPGGATQFRTPLHARALEDAGYLEFEREVLTSYADDAEQAEIFAALEEERLAARRPPISSDMATMVDDIDAAEAAMRPSPVATIAEHADDAERVTALEPLADAAEASHSLGLAGMLAAAGSAFQFGSGIGEFLTGEYDQGTFDTVAGGLGLGSTLASAGMLGEGAAATALAAPPVAVGAAALGLIAAGHEHNAEHDVWGDPTVDEDGEVHHLTSVDFALANGGDAFNGIHDAVTMGLGGGDIADGLGVVAGGLGGALVGLGAGVVGLGGDLVGGVEATGEALAPIVTAGDRYMAERGVWDDPEATAAIAEEESAPHEPHARRHHRSSVDMVVDDTRATYAEYHDAAAEAGFGEVGATIAGGAAGTAMALGDSVLALGGNIVGLAGAAVDTAGVAVDRVGSAASRLWSWMTD